MTLSADHAKLLKRALRGRSRADIKKLFAAIRATDDRALLAAIAPAKKSAAKRRGDPLVRDLERTLKPILGPAVEKADMLVEHLAKKHRRKLAFEPKGLADAAKQLRARFSDDQIRAGAKSLVAHLSKLYGDRETVV
jgi:cell division septum initiation protein DivIVA